MLEKTELSRRRDYDNNRKLSRTVEIVLKDYNLNIEDRVCRLMYFHAFG